MLRSLGDGVDLVESFAQYRPPKVEVIQDIGDEFSGSHSVCLPLVVRTFTTTPILLHLHGKTIYYKMPNTPWYPISFYCPTKNSTRFFVCVFSLDPPINKAEPNLLPLPDPPFLQGRGHFLDYQHEQEEMKKLSDWHSIITYWDSFQEMVGQVVKALVNHRITVPGNFQGPSLSPAPIR